MIKMQQIAQPHIESFNYFLTEGLRLVAENLRPIEFQYEESRIRITILSLAIAKPKQSDTSKSVYPSECRRSGRTYSGALIARLQLTVDGKPVTTLERNFGEVPIMVRSRGCNLHGMNEDQLIKVHEEPKELGGYFIVNGKERVIRMIVLPRRNFPICVTRPSFKKRGQGYTEDAVIMRSVAADQSVAVNVLHWLVVGEPILNFSHGKDKFFIPVSLILRALVTASNTEIYDEILRGNEESLSLKQTAVVMLARLSDIKYDSREKALAFIGLHFRRKLGLPEWYTDLEVGRYLMEECILIHLDSDGDKFSILTYMIRKLHAFVKEKCCVESNDRGVFQEAMLPGHLYAQVMKEKIEMALRQLRSLAMARKRSVARLKSRSPGPSSIVEMIADHSNRVGKGISDAMVYFLSTGNLISRSGLGLMQTTGLVIPLDNINFLRTASNFRALHRGAFFQEMKTTEARKLLPEVYGFICPVHTPDGPPCGLLNHLSINCRIVNRSFRADAKQQLLDVLLRNDLWLPSYPRSEDPDFGDWLSVLVDGRMVGWLSVEGATEAERQIRQLKTQHDRFMFVEVSVIPRTSVASQYPGLYIFTEVARLMRPVVNVEQQRREWLGMFEQPYLSIAPANAQDLGPSWTHQEEAAENLFSFVASLTPFPEYNQSPRNMYQCQMGKQTMGHSCYTWRYRADNKAYRLLTPQKPLVKTRTYDDYTMDTYPLGFNAIVAVLSYSAYDMEDAMVINKGSFDRGLAHACIYKSQVINLLKESGIPVRRGLVPTDCCLQFGVGPDGAADCGLDPDGFPPIGTRLTSRAPLFAYFHKETGVTTVKKYMGDQPAFVEAVSLNGSQYQATLTLRVQRLPDIGDKFSSRHGQKGVNSILMPTEDMPFTASGMVPDLIFNPNGIPSRMTIGKMIEFLGGKIGALSGKSIDATAFQRPETAPPYFDLMKRLKRRGYDYCGTETLYAGMTGRPIEAEVYMGVIYYQRLRHMVADKWQVRTTGCFDQVTRQPMKGRSVGGGIRLGEMERDCLISLAAPSILQERMFSSGSDRSSALVCDRCGSMVDVRCEAGGDAMSRLMGDVSERFRRRWRCVACDRRGHSLMRVSIPHVLRLLVLELASMNIRSAFHASRLSGWVGDAAEEGMGKGDVGKESQAVDSDTGEAL